tara:strand:+ start:131 stop:691 length:561 start_codon:yes stop_codon:yes gene_type:complete
MELSEEQLVVIAEGLRDIKPTSGWEGVYSHVKKSSLFKDWKIPDSKVKYIAEVIKIYDYNIPKACDSLLGSDGFKGFENYSPSIDEPDIEHEEKPKKKTASNTNTKKTKASSSSSSSSSSSNNSIGQAAKIVDYQALRDKTLSGLEAKVKAEMRKGWVPYGGVAAAAFGISPTGGNSFIQAVVKIK